MDKQPIYTPENNPMTAKNTTPNGICGSYINNRFPAVPPSMITVSIGYVREANPKRSVIRGITPRMVISAKTPLATANPAANPIKAIPVDAVREALINSFCHKEYGTGQNNEVSIYKDRVEIYNPGTFPAGYEPEDFISGRERPIRRNPLIAQTLYYSKNVESFGTGLKRIADACDAAGCKYKFEVLKSGFVVVFYRSDENFDTTGTDTTPVTIPVNTPDKDIRSKIVSLCLNAPQTREQLMQACGMKNKAHFLKAYLKPMLETGELQLTVPDKPNSRNQKYIAVRHTTGEVR